MGRRTSRLTLHAEWREKIQASQLLNRLRDHALGKIQMSATQIRAAEILLRKCLPDLAIIEYSGETEVRHVFAVPLAASPELDKLPAEKWLERVK